MKRSEVVTCGDIEGVSLGGNVGICSVLVYGLCLPVALVGEMDFTSYVHVFFQSGLSQSPFLRADWRPSPW